MASTLSSARRRTSATLSTLAFRHGRPGVAGWVALLAPGACTGAAVAAVATSRRPSTRRLAVGAGIGAAGAVLLGRLIDEIRWRRGAVSLTVDGPDTALDLMQAVRARGVQADMVRADENEPVGRHYALRYRAKDDRRVRAVLAEQHL